MQRAEAIAKQGKGKYEALKSLTDEGTIRQLKSQYGQEIGDLSLDAADEAAAMGKWQGATAGMGTGATIGAGVGNMIAPGLGHIPGTIIGGGLGAMAGSPLGAAAARALSTLRNKIKPSKNLLDEAAEAVTDQAMKPIKGLKNSPKSVGGLRRAVGWDDGQAMSEIEGFTRKGKDKAKAVGLGGALGLTGAGAGGVGLGLGAMALGGGGEATKTNPIDDTLNAYKAKDQKLTGSIGKKNTYFNNQVRSK